MKLPERIEAFCKLGQVIKGLGLNERKALAEKARNENPWFTESSVELSLKGIEVILEESKLIPWSLSYQEVPSVAKTVGVVMAGNIPLVGFHDFLCVLVSGHRLRAKLSAQDSVLLRFIFEKLREIEPRFSDKVSFEENLKGIDAMIGTGSDNTARYFEYYFRNIPHIIRKNRSSCAIVLGEESGEELALLGQDVFSYFGLGCRNISKLFVPEDFDFSLLIKSWAPNETILHHHKYANNYDYQKSILTANQVPFIEGGHFLLRENHDLVSPVAILYYEKYKGQLEVSEAITKQAEKLQVIASARGWYPGSVPFGKAQLPEVNDYADKVDTMKFLLELR